MTTDTCPCGSEKPYADCCEPIIRGEREPETAEALMRARYSAYVNAEIDFIMASQHPDTVDNADREVTENWASGSDWLGLTIRETEDGGPNDDEGVVEFRARYRQYGNVVNHDERAYFTRHDGAWKFHSVLADEDEQELVPVSAAAPAGRNDPCPCGSGRKYKKCCGAA